MFMKLLIALSFFCTVLFALTLGCGSSATPVADASETGAEAGSDDAEAGATDAAEVEASTDAEAPADASDAD
jgi:hypothetical protein